MNHLPFPLRRMILLLNSVAILLYLVWLAVWRQHILYSRDGVLYLLPGLLMFFVFAVLLAPRSPPGDDDEAARRRDEDRGEE